MAYQENSITRDEDVTDETHSRPEEESNRAIRMTFVKKAGLICLSLTILACILFAIQIKEYTVKAVFLEHFTRFVEWPEECGVSDTSRPFVLGVLGKNPFGNTLEEVFKTQKIRKKRVKVMYPSNVEEAEKCHLLFISRSEEKELEHILSFMRKRPVLTVSDTQGFAEKGVLINLYLEEEMVRFEINERAVRESGLFMSYLLLKHARIVIPGGGAE